MIHMLMLTFFSDCAPFAVGCSRAIEGQHV